VQDILSGAAFVQQGPTGEWERFQFALPDDLTIDVCEAFALWKAVLSVPVDELVACVFCDSAATLSGLLKFSKRPHAYRFKDQYQMFTEIIRRISAGRTHFYFIKVESHVEPLDGYLTVSEGNIQADQAAKDAALLGDSKCDLPGHEEPGVFGIQLRERDGGPWPPPPGNEEQPRNLDEWRRIPIRLLQRKLYQRGLYLFIQREAQRSYKDARDLATGSVMSSRMWLRCLNPRFDDRTMIWWYQARAYGLNYWFRGVKIVHFIELQERQSLRDLRLGLLTSESVTIPFSGPATLKSTMHASPWSALKYGSGRLARRLCGAQFGI
jgi:hypothetical protein